MPNAKQPIWSNLENRALGLAEQMTRQVEKKGGAYVRGSDISQSAMQ